MSETFFRGFREAMGSWKIICMSFRSMPLVSRSIFPDMSDPWNVIEPEVGL